MSYKIQFSHVPFQSLDNTELQDKKVLTLNTQFPTYAFKSYDLC